MAIFRCKKCGHIREAGSNYLGKSIKCPKCEQINPIHDTVAFLKTLIKKYIDQNKEIKNLRQLASGDSSVDEIADAISLAEVDIHNTNVLTQPNNLEPIRQYFVQRNIQINIDQNAADTTGFFDEIALLIGNSFNVLSYVISQIKYGQNKEYTSAKIELKNKNPQESKQIISFCKALHDYSFVARYTHKKKDKVIYLTLQKMPVIKRFFDGIWMEWFVLIKLLTFFREQKIAPACTKSLKITFPKGNSNELDLFCLAAKNVPICIECKSGEFRHDIDKYISLRKQLKVDKNQFIICVFGLSLEHAEGMTKMYDLTFVNETSLIQHIQTVL